MFTPFAFIKSVAATPSNDPDAQAFIDATGISGTDATAINTLVLDLKAYSLWTQMKVIYPMVGGTSTTCKYNLKNPLDTDAANRLSFVGGWTFSSTGADPNGTNAYADTFFSLNSFTTNDNHISYYSRNDSSGVMMGVDFNTRYFMSPDFDGSRALFPIQTNNATTLTLVNATGYFIGTRTGTNATEIYKNNATIETPNDASATLENRVINLARRNGATNYFGGECAFATIGDGLSDAEAGNLNTVVQTFNTTLSRNV